MKLLFCPCCESELKLHREDYITYLYCASGRCYSYAMNDGVAIENGDMDAAYKRLEIAAEEESNSYER